MPLTRNQHLQYCASMFNDTSLWQWWAKEPFYSAWELNDLSAPTTHAPVATSTAIAAAEAASAFAQHGKPELAVQIYNALWKEDPKITLDEVQKYLLLGD